MLAKRGSGRTAYPLTRLASPLRAGVLSLAMLSLTACASPSPSGPGRERFVVQPVTLDHQIHFAPDDEKLPHGSEIDRLQSFLLEIDGDRSGAILIEANVTQSSVARRSAIEDLVTSTGRRLADVRERDLPSDIVAVRIRRHVILPTSCLESDGWPTTEDLPPGCINDLNLLHMVENERDLLQGRPLGLAPAAPAGDLIRGYLTRFRQYGPDAGQPGSRSPAGPSASFIE